MRLTFYGVRGSTPAPGRAYVRYGGNTACVAVSLAGEAPRLVLDAGTGLPHVGGLLGGGPFNGTILLGHLHWDHTHGIPFFGNARRPDAHTHVLIPEQGDAETILDRVISPPHFPVHAGELEGNWTFGGIDAGWHEIEGCRVLALDIPHPGGRMLGFRLEAGGVSVCYISDHAPVMLGPGPEGFGEYHENAMTLSRDVDLLIHDAQYTAEEFPSRALYGHSACDYAVGLARRANARALALFHHDPQRTDDAVDAILAHCRDIAPPGLEVQAATEEMTVEVTARSGLVQAGG